MFKEGVNNRRYWPINEKENARIYAESQQQRYLEREIRKWKREADVLTTAGLDASFEKSKVREKQANMRSFINQTGRMRDYSKEQIK